MAEKTILCVECRATFSPAEIGDVTGCPACGSEGIPADLRARRALTFTDHEWRILFMWAAAYADSIVGSCPSAPKAIAGIRREAKAQQPTMPALSLFEEVQDLADSIGLPCELAAPDGGGTTTFIPATKH